MFNFLFSAAWAVCPMRADAVANLLSNIVKSGPVEDANRMGLPIEKSGKQAIVKTVGPMVKHAGWMVRYGLAGTRETQAALLSAAQDDDVENIIWLMDTPGGSVDGLEELAATVRQIKQIKPVIVQVDGLLASAGYYVASQASQIYASPGDLVGSIGTRMSLYDYSEAAKKEGVKAIPIDTGVHKSAGMPGTKITDEQIAEYQRIVDGYFSMFITAIEQGRRLPKAGIKKLADGRVFFAAESVNYGLIDGEQTLNDTLAQFKTPLQKRESRSARTTLARAKLTAFSA